METFFINRNTLFEKMESLGGTNGILQKVKSDQFKGIFSS